ncbi:unnamed protein product [Lactuca saligna]|uniref:Uncharacterized protein n=1 Tax=Lactuca saligna TaxID=75948 RepID=A0AA35Z816_LACSI|nr:unnamed protein product [Lactuca saligna]
MFENDNTIVGAIMILTSFNMWQNPSSLKSFYDFCLSSSSEESKEEEHNEDNKYSSPKAFVEIDQGNEAQSNMINYSTPSEPHGDMMMTMIKSLRALPHTKNI